MSSRKDDKGKPPLSLIPLSALQAEARVMAHGKAKYGAHNWREGGLEWSRVIDAALRHIYAFASGYDLDDGPDGSGELHLANARCCLAFLIEYHEQGLGTDDRYKAKFLDAASLYEVIATGRAGIAVSVGVYSTQREAEIALTRELPNWPTFTLSIRESTDDDDGTEAA